MSDADANGPSRWGISKGAVIGAVAGAGSTMLLAPAVLAGIGFTAGGIAAGSVAAGMMSSAAVANGGMIAAGSLVAIGQSAGAAGLSATAATALGTGGAAVGAGLGWLSSKLPSKL